MKIGCVKEIKNNEYRVGLTPDNVKAYGRLKKLLEDLIEASKASTGNLKAELEKMVLPCETKGNTTQATFTGSSYSARLYRVDFDEPSGVAIYRFEFTAWKTNSATYVEAISMNRLMTAVEKAFLALDPNTAVTSYDIDFKTKHSII